MAQDSVILRSEAIAIRVSPHSQTSQVVIWLTPESGRVVTLVKGACRPKSDFLGQYDLFTTSELLYYDRNREGIHIARECTLLNPRLGLRANWRAAAAASYICDLAARTMDGEGQVAGAYELVRGMLDQLEGEGVSIPIILWFELQLLDRLGLSPRLDACVVCGAAVDAEPELLFSAGDGGLRCRGCGRAEGQRIGADSIAMLSRWQKSDGPAVAWRTRGTPRQMEEVATLMGEFLHYHLDVGPLVESRRAAMAVLAPPAPLVPARA